MDSLPVGVILNELVLLSKLGIKYIKETPVGEARWLGSLPTLDEVDIWRCEIIKALTEECDYYKKLDDEMKKILMLNCK